jgi:hypothetical protein
MRIGGPVPVKMGGKQEERIIEDGARPQPPCLPLQSAGFFGERGWCTAARYRRRSRST